MKQGAAIICAGGHARVIASMLKASGIDILGFFDDSFIGPETIQGAPVLGKFCDVESFKNQISAIYLAISDNSRRREFFLSFKEKGFRLPSLVHPMAMIEHDVFIGEASVICMGSKLGVESKIGTGVIINTGCSVDHESHIGDFVHLAPQVVVAGRSSVGDNTFIGINAAVADKIKIGKNVVIGAGSVILKNVADYSKVSGIHNSCA